MAVGPQQARVVGIDDRTLSGRAVVVRVSGAPEPGTGVHESNMIAYNALFAEYTALHDYFGRGASK